MTEDDPIARQIENNRAWAATFREGAAEMTGPTPAGVAPELWIAQRDSYIREADRLDTEATELEQSLKSDGREIEKGGFNRYGYDLRPEGWNDSVMCHFFTGPELRVIDQDFRAAFAERAAVTSAAPVVYDDKDTSAPPCAGGAGATNNPPLGAPAFPATAKAKDPMPLSFIDRARLAWRIITCSGEANSLKYAERELLLAFPPDAEDGDMPGWNDAMRKQCLEALLVFSVQGNGGMSASVAIPTIERLMRQEPLTPITGEDDQWTDVGDGYFQHRRCSHVFKEGPAGQPYTIEGYVFREPEVMAEDFSVYRPTFTGMGSARAISFPWTPTAPKVVDVDSEGNRLDGLPRLSIMPEVEEGEDTNPVRAILSAAAKQFRDYQAQHMAKWEAMTEHERERNCWDKHGSALEKAGVNQRWAEQLELTAEALVR